MPFSYGFERLLVTKRKGCGEDNAELCNFSCTGWLMLKLKAQEKKQVSQ